MRGNSIGHGTQGGNSGPGPLKLTISGIPLGPQHWWLT